MADILDELVGAAKAMVGNGENEIIPHLVVVDGTGEHHHIGLLDLGEMEKDAFKPTLVFLLMGLGAQAYLLVIEAWMTTAVDEVQKYGRVGALPPDDRSDIIMVNAVEKGGASRSCYAIVDFKPEGRRIRDWQEILADGESELTGRMFLTAREWANAEDTVARVLGDRRRGG